MKATFTLWFVVAPLWTAAACGSPGDGDRPPLGDHAFVVANEVYTADGSDSYINVMGTLDDGGPDPDLALEIAGGRATIGTFGGWLFIAPADRPVITRYAIGDHGELTLDGEVSFANYGYESVWIDEWGNTFISATKAYLMNADDGTTVVWNPTEMTITAEIAPLESLIREGTTLNGSPGVVRGDRLFRTFFWSNWDAYETSTEQYLGVYDVETDEMLALVEDTRCPGLSNRIERDGDDNLYASNWMWNVSETLISGAAPSCALRISVGAETFDPDWVLDFPAVTDGRQAAMFSILDADHGLLNVFHDERVTFDATSDPNELASTKNWRLWSIDLDAGTGQPVDGLDWMNGGASTFHVGGRTFVFVPGADWSVTSVHEIEGGAASRMFDLEGWSYQFFQVR